MQRFIVYIVTVVIFGVLLSAVTTVVIDFVPFFIAGLVTISPMYGLFRTLQRRAGKNTFVVTHGLRYFGSLATQVFKSQKESIGFFGGIAIAVILQYKLMGVMFLKTVISSVVAVTAVFIIWESARLVIRIARKVDILSFKDAVRSAL